MAIDLPRYKITIDEEYSDGESLGIKMIAYTKTPAILTKGMAFKNHESKKQFFSDELKYRIVAPAMIPMEIYRCDEDEEYYVQFTEEEIDKIHSKFMKTASKENVFNLEHNADEVVPAYVLEVWIVDDPKTDKSFQTYGIDVPKGTLMMISQVTDKDVYKELVKNEQTGYSIEGFLGMSLTEIINKNKEEKMNEKLMLPNGEHEIAGKIYVVKDGVITEIKEVAEQDLVADEAIQELIDDVVEKVNDEELAEEVKEKVEEEELSEEVKEEELAEEIVEEVKGEVVSYSKEELDEKFEELYKMIADLKVEEEVEKEIETEPTQLSAHQRLSQFRNFTKGRK